jgi:septum formation protein
MQPRLAVDVDTADNPVAHLTFDILQPVSEPTERGQRRRALNPPRFTGEPEYIRNLTHKRFHQDFTRKPNAALFGHNPRILLWFRSAVKGKSAHMPNPTPNLSPRLILASTSAYRRQLLERLGLPFEIVRPQVDERARPGETPPTLAQRLARAKAEAVARRNRDAFVIGSDQVAALGGEIFGKPGTLERAVAQLLRMSGQEVTFHTAVALVDRRNGRTQLETVPTRVRFRPLDEDEIRRYLAREPAFDCAGSAKYEGLGITLLDALSGDDPTALIGLPLIALARMLRAVGVELP